MIAINKSPIVPSKLNDTVTQREFSINISNKAYFGKDRYREVKKELHSLYHNKCAYCESDITVGSHNSIEHYRPKVIYYWLAYSWDNLLLACPKCNTKKGSNFEITNSQRVAYNSELLSDLHNKTPDYDKIENPSLLNPEQLTDIELQRHFSFNAKGELLAKTKRMEYTIDVRDLNRDILVKKRILILNDFIMNYKLSSNKQEIKNIIKNLLQKAITNNSEYIAWRKFLISIIDKLKN